ncbi:hypothetical protein [Paraburkholderia youngii]|uniref:hypothetical protein n=1 Tax=Paraburkholderia youngii TaxID=2782701 RepID=UPI00159271B4|nr:hypothetical protein [Paraburkholderia youngii]NUX58659.1 hypothetical protein [Paraburkholderia youngii]
MTVENGSAEELTEQQLWDEEAKATDAPADAPVVVQPAAETTPVETVVEQQQQQQQQTDDPYAGLHPTIRAKLEAQDLLAERLRKAEGHIGGLSSENKRITAELAAAKAAADAVRSAPTQTQVANAQRSTEKWDQLKQDFPEWADALEERLGSNAQPDLDGLRRQIRDELTPQLTSEISARLKADIAAETEGRLVNVAHRGWKDLVKTPEFTAWYGQQPEHVKALGASPTAEDAITLLDHYKAQAASRPDAAAIKASRQQRMQDAATVVRGNAAMAPVKSTDDMTPEEYWNHLARQDAAATKR